MITRIILIAALLMMRLSLFGAELSVYYIGGWAPSYSLDLDFDQGVLLYKGPVKTGERATTSVEKPIKDAKKNRTLLQGAFIKHP